LITLKHFGLEKGPLLYSIIHISFGFSSIIDSILIETVKRYVGFDLMFYVYSVVICFAILCVVLIDEN
jgi:hypothetical protein